LSGCYGSSLLSMDIPRIGEVRPQEKEIRSQIMSLRIAAHAADLAKAHPGAQVLDNAICKARSEGRIKDLAHLSFDPWQAARSISAE
jgi:phosphomethylpyrimidine synthase